MCGIVGYVGKRDCTEVLLNGLGKLEYRGYDSAGIAYICVCFHMVGSQPLVKRCSADGSFPSETDSLLLSSSRIAGNGLVVIGPVSVSQGGIGHLIRQGQAIRELLAAHRSLLPGE